jgi:2-dehydropantoate 2-reductase
MKPSIGKVAIIGAGALGAAYGSILYEMDPRCVCFIASGERYEKLKREGVVVNGKRYAIALARPEKATPADLLIVAVKHHHLDQAIGDMKKAIGPGTTILSVMNGIDSEERIGAVYGMDTVVYGLTLGIDAVREGSRVNYTNQGRIFFGEAKNPDMTDRVQRIHELFDRAGIAHVIPPDMIRSLWFKYMVNVGANQASAVLRANYGALRSSSEARGSHGFGHAGSHRDRRGDQGGSLRKGYRGLVHGTRGPQPGGKDLHVPGCRGRPQDGGGDVCRDGDRAGEALRCGDPGEPKALRRSEED